MIVFAEQLTPRLKYVAAFIGGQLYGKSLELTDDVSVYSSYEGIRINYSSKTFSTPGINIQPHGLLYQQDISEQYIEISPDDPQMRFFKNNSDTRFDIFAAVFYLLSRYEEYLPHRKDDYGRYAHVNSIAFIYKFLHLPLADQWILSLKQQLAQVFPEHKSVYQPGFKLLPTYDIDMAWSYKGRGAWRNLGGIIRSFLKGNLDESRARIKTLRNRKQDPFDSFDWLDDLHIQHGLKPVYFFLLAARPGIYDRNNDPSGSLMKQLVRRIATRYPTGIHPSWRSGDESELVQQEINTLNELTGNGTLLSRQHYIRFDLPVTFRELIKRGISHDYSMGYGSINGFRASTSFPFYWYDLERNEETSLLLHPFCYMDANSFYEQGQTAGQALEEMIGYYERVREVSGSLVMIWHNHFLGSDPRFEGWQNAYSTFIKDR